VNSGKEQPNYPWRPLWWKQTIQYFLCKGSIFCHN
jgi:hypothetical protein